MRREVRLVDFIDSLADDPELEAVFDLEPVAVMTQAGLSVDQQALLPGGTTGEIRNALNAELEGVVNSTAVAFVSRRRSSSR
jgi:predicted exporter